MNLCPVSSDQWELGPQEITMVAFELLGAVFITLFLAALVSGEQAPTR